MYPSIVTFSVLLSHEVVPLPVALAACKFQLLSAEQIEDNKSIVTAKPKNLLPASFIIFPFLPFPVNLRIKNKNS
jgi:hypothetical protein